MKRIFIILVTFGVILCAFSSCAEKEYDSICFTQFLDTNGFSAELSESEFLDLLAKYTYNGKKITEIAHSSHFDGIILSGGYFGGLTATSELFEYGHSYESAPSEHKSEYYFWFSTDIRGLSLPCKIAFGDSFSRVLSKLGIKTVPTESCTLNENGTDSLIFTDSQASTETSAESKDYELVFTQTSTKESTTRTVTFVFEKDTQKLTGVKIIASKTTS